MWVIIIADRPKSSVSEGPFTRSDQEVLSMSENPLETIERFEKLAAWHRINAERAGADWVWEARLRTAEDLERRAEKIRRQLSSGDSVKIEIAALPGRRRKASDEIGTLIAVPDGE
jgi:hypothetical protein